MLQMHLPQHINTSVQKITSPIYGRFGYRSMSHYQSISQDCNIIDDQLKVLGLQELELSQTTLDKLKLITAICQLLQVPPNEIQQEFVKIQLENIPLKIQVLELQQSLKRLENRKAAGTAFLDKLSRQREQSLKNIQKQKEYILNKQADLKFASVEIESLKNEISQLQNSIPDIQISQNDILVKKKCFDEECRQVQQLEKELERYNGLRPNIDSARATIEKLKTK
eukprot:TRINITY_DN5164_c0_g1_i2.p1 TRINITY_DN5164_c0_g1~~TRINITY_DN5164_c0_g1_i2.p1  ORF type:complete len:225 (-),score=20.74 TRINITY_DN5164_c0_g1_i2:92-766(-)